MGIYMYECIRMNHKSARSNILKSWSLSCISTKNVHRLQHDECWWPSFQVIAWGSAVIRLQIVPNTSNILHNKITLVNHPANKKLRSLMEGTISWFSSKALTAATHLQYILIQSLLWIKYRVRAWVPLQKNPARNSPWDKFSLYKRVGNIIFSAEQVEAERDCGQVSIETSF